MSSLDRSLVPALFLDRDGVVNVNHGYVHTPDKFDFIPGIFDLVRKANELGLLVVIVTNQSGIGRGYYSENTFLKLTDWMLAEFEQQGALITDVLYCPHHPNEANEPYKVECECRKPNKGLAIEAANKHNIDLTKSIMVGDKPIDVEFALKASMKHAYYFKNELETKDVTEEENTVITKLTVTLINTLEQVKFNR